MAEAVVTISSEAKVLGPETIGGLSGVGLGFLGLVVSG